MALHACIRREEISQIYDFNFYLKLEKEEQMKPELSRRKDIIKIRGEISEMENRETIEKNE